MFNSIQRRPVIWTIKDLGRKKVTWTRVTDRQSDSLQVPYLAITVSYSCEQLFYFSYLYTDNPWKSNKNV